MTDVWTKWEGLVINGVFPLRRFLSRSNHSVVFLTEYLAKNLPDAAIKLVPADPVRGEAQLACWRMDASLSHPHLIRLFDVGRCQLGGHNFIYVVMEFADQTLAQLLTHRALTADEVREMLPPVLDALAFLHRKRLVQGQLKPPNILVVDDQLKLASDTVRPAGASTVSVAKTSFYDPPEAKDGRLYGAGDVWALGITLVEALTQRDPVWPDENSDAVSVPVTLPRAFADTIGRCLSRNPVNRPSIADLEAQFKGAPAAPVAPAAESVAQSQPVVPAEEVRSAEEIGSAEEAGQPQDGVQPKPAVQPAVQPAPVAGPSPVVQALPATRPSPVVQPLPATRPSPPVQPSPVAQLSLAVGPSPVAQPSPAARPSPVVQPSPTARPSPVGPPEPRALAATAVEPGTLAGRAAAEVQRVTAAVQAVWSRAPLSQWVIKARLQIAIAAGGLIVLSVVWAAFRLIHSPLVPQQPAPVASDTPPPHIALPVPVAASSAASQNPPASRPAPLAVLHQEIPEASRSARESIRGRISVTIRVVVDRSGNVIHESVEYPGSSRYFARLGFQASKKWKFAPADSQEPRVWLLRFEFTRSGTTGHAAPRT